MSNYSLYQYPLRPLLTVFGAKPMRRLLGTFSCPKVFIGRMSLIRGLGSIAMTREKKRAFFVTDEPLRKLAESLIPVFKTAGFTTNICCKAEPEPPIPIVDEIAKEMQEFEPDLLVAVGGGSAIDACKAAWIKYEKPETDLGSLIPLMPIGIRKKALMMAVPTTAGTGSEATFSMVLSDPKSEPPRKIAVSHPEVIPDYVALIPEMTLGMPLALTVGTGLDALSHAFEAFINRQWSSPLTDALAIGAIKTIMKYLPIVYRNPKSIEGRFQMQMAAFMAGMAFGNSSAALTHSLGHSLGKIFKIHHGLAVGIFIPYILKYEAKMTEDYMELAKSLGIEAKNKEEYLDKLVNKFVDFMKDLGVSIALKDLNISRSDFEKQLDYLAKYAMEDPTVVQSMRPTSEEELRKIFEYAYEGKMVDW
ncbi:MAG: iron-containing alcohol dehydrogenase [Candidatus Jordarchaeaceae archaeon]